MVSAVSRRADGFGDEEELCWWVAPGGTELGKRFLSAQLGQHLYIQRSLDLPSGNRETPWGMGITQKLDGSKLQMRGCTIPEGSSSISSVSAAQSLCW